MKQYVTDLHLHSKYSRAVSQQMTLPVMARYAQQKGLDILTASDFTHPVWFKEISALLEEEGEGMYVLKAEADSLQKTRFILSTEISSIYKQGDKLRRIHNLVFAPSLAVVEKINAALIKRGCNLNADGRPIIGLTSKALLELILEIDERCFLIPCHVWTPHFGIYGSASGFDSLEEAFGELAPQIFGIETGLSSDPDMNWSMVELRNRSILSFSDAHSPAKMGREATVVELESLTYSSLKQAFMRPMKKGIKGTIGTKSIKSKIGNVSPSDTSDTFATSDTSRIIYTVEFYPEEGKYHFSGHRNCKVSYGPEEIREKGNICPVCHRKMTEGVLYRVQQLADPQLIDRLETKHNAQGLQWFTDKKHSQPPYVKLVPLLEIVAEAMESTVASQKVQQAFTALCASLGSEMNVLLKVQIEEIAKVGGGRVAEGVEKVRAGSIVIEPGYDGEYGKVEIWKEGEEKEEVKNNDSQMQMEF